MKRSLFAPSRTDVAGSPLEQMLDNLRNQAAQVGGGALIRTSLTSRGVSLEGLSDHAVRGELESAVADLTQVIRQSVSGIATATGTAMESLSPAQIEAGNVAALASAHARSYMGREVGANALARFASENTRVIGHTHMTGVAEGRIDMQAFDEKENKNAAIYSVSYNLYAAKQDEFGQAFYPTVVVTPDNVGFMMSIRLMYVFDEVRREISGDLNKFNRKNVIKAVIDASILRNDQTKIVPIYRKTTPAAATDSDKWFVSELGSTTIKLDNHDVETGVLAVGKKFSLIGLSQTEALLSAGVMDSTDAVDSSARLAAVYVKVDDEIFKFNTLQLPLSDFNAAPQGNSRLLQLNFSNSSLLLNKDSEQADGSASTILAALGTNAVRLGVSLAGSILQDKGDTIVNAAPVEVARVTDADGNELSTASGAGATIAALFEEAVVVGYDLLAYRTNSNRRQRGQLIDTQYMNYLYTVPLLPPITALRPVGETEQNDAALLSALITTTHVRTSNAAVTALLEAAAFLREYTNSADKYDDAPEILGVARYLVSAAYIEENLDTELNLDSLTSKQRTEDLQALLQNKIRDIAYRLYVSSGYKAAADALYDGNAPKPLLIVGTDPILARYLTINGDLRLVGETIDYKIVSTLDSRMAGKIVISFGMESSYTSGAPNPLHFGNMAWKPELTLMMPMVRNGANVMELTVQPSFRHVTNLPVLGVINVTNIDKVIASKVDVYTNEQS